MVRALPGFRAESFKGEASYLPAAPRWPVVTIRQEQRELLMGKVRRLRNGVRCRGWDPATMGLLLLFFFAAYAGGQDGEERLPVPSGASLKNAEETVRASIRDSSASRSAAGKRKLAERLLSSAKREEKDTVMKYALLRGAQDMAVEGGDARLALKAAQTLAQIYQVDGATLKLEAVTEAARKVRGRSEAGSAVHACLTLLREVVAADDFDGSKKLLDTAKKVVRRIKDASLSTKIKDIAYLVGKISQQHRKAVAALKKFETNPQDSRVGAEVGRYLCFYKNQWSGNGGRRSREPAAMSHCWFWMTSSSLPR